MAKIFISYTRRDKNLAEECVRQLSKFYTLGYVWTYRS